MKTLFYLVYNVLILAAVPIAWIVAFFNDKLGGSFTGQKEIARRVLTFRDKLKTDPKPVIWTHAASAGEFEQMRPVLTRLASMNVYIFQTFTSATIYYKASQNKVFNGVCFLPWDLYTRVDRFVRLLQPDLFINTRHDIWPNLYLALHRRGVRNILINANLYENSFRLKPGIRRLNSLVFEQIDHIYTGSEALQHLLSNIYKGSIDVVGDSRFDQVHERAQKNTEMLISESILTDRRVIIYGSVGDSDLDLITSAISKLPSNKAFLHIIVPHETAERDIVPWEAQFFKHGLKSIRKSEIELYKDESVLIWDSVGQLADLYKYAHLAYIGAGFGAGVHSVTEAAVYSVPSAHGPKYDILAEAIELVEKGLSTVVTETDELTDYLMTSQAEMATTSKAITAFIESRIGATDRIINSEPMLSKLIQQ